MRLIDADALWEEFCRSEAIEERYGSGVLEIVGNIIDNAPLTEALYRVPSADVAPVVRCEDCKFSELFQNDSSGVMARYCKAFTFERMVADNDFCSYGERKDDD